MSLGLAFWIVMLLAILFGVWRYRADYFALGGNGILLFLVFLLGWKVFGAPIHG